MFQQISRAPWFHGAESASSNTSFMVLQTNLHVCLVALHALRIGARVCAYWKWGCQSRSPLCCVFESVSYLLAFACPQDGWEAAGIGRFRELGFRLCHERFSLLGLERIFLKLILIGVYLPTLLILWMHKPRSKRQRAEDFLRCFTRSDRTTKAAHQDVTAYLFNSIGTWRSFAKTLFKKKTPVGAPLIIAQSPPLSRHAVSESWDTGEAFVQIKKRHISKKSFVFFLDNFIKWN